MNAIKVILYFIILCILIYLLCNQFKVIFTENFTIENSEVISEPPKETITEEKEEVKTEPEIKIDQEETKEQDTPESTLPILSEMAKSDTPKPEYQEINEQPIISTQNEIIKNSDSAYVTQQNQQREDPEVDIKYYDAKTETIIDGVKVIPHSLLSPWADAYMDQTNNYLLDIDDDKDGGSMRYTKRSPACCSPTYPPPFQLRVDPTICKDKDNYVPNPYTGSDNWTNAGCSCATKRNIMKLAHRGGNA